MVLNWSNRLSMMMENRNEIDGGRIRDLERNPNLEMALWWIWWGEIMCDFGSFSFFLSFEVKDLCEREGDEAQRNVYVFRFSIHLRYDFSFILFYFILFTTVFFIKHILLFYYHRLYNYYWMYFLFCSKKNLFTTLIY